MVLSASAAHNEPGPREAAWFAPLKLSLRLSKAAILLHVGHAQPERLGELVRGLASDYPNLDVSADVRAAATVPEGSLLVLLPKAVHADWLNLERPIFARRGLKVVLFCDHETSIALAQNAPDFFDWISRHVDCPPGAAMHAVLGLRAALAADASVVWTSPDDPDKPGNVERAWNTFSSAFPGQTLRWINPMKDYGELVADVRSAGDEWVACRPRAATHVRRFRWALAEAGRRSRALVATSEFPCPGYWPVHDQLMPFEEARRVLERAGAAQAGCIAALTGLEPETVELAKSLLGEGVSEDRLVELLRDAQDPGAALAREKHKTDATSLAEVVRRTASPPALRAFAGEPAVNRLRKKNFRTVEAKLAKGAEVGAQDLGEFAANRPAPRSMGRPLAGDIEVLSFAVECTLRRTPRPAIWAHLAEQAIVAGEPGAAGVWALRSLKRLRTPPAVLSDVAKQLSDLGDWRGAVLRAELAIWTRSIPLPLLPPTPQGTGLLLVLLLLFWYTVDLDFEIKVAVLAVGGFQLARVVFWWLGSLLRMNRILVDDREDASAIATHAASVKQEQTSWHQAIERGDYADAATGLGTLFSYAKTSLGAEHLLSRSIQHGHAIALLESGEDSQALGVLNQAIALEARIDGVEHTGFTALIPTVAEAFTRTGRAAQAEALLRKLLGPEARLPGEGETQPPAPAEVSAGSMSAETDEALALFLSQPSAPRLSLEARVHALRLLAEALHVQGRYEEAEALLDRAIGQLPELGSAHREQWRTRLSLGRVLAVERRTEEACAILRDAAARAQAAAGERHPDHGRILAELARLEQRMGKG